MDLQVRNAVISLGEAEGFPVIFIDIFGYRLEHTRALPVRVARLQELGATCEEAVEILGTISWEFGEII